MNRKELGRQMIHVLIGITLIVFIFMFGKTKLVALTFFTLLIGSVLINMKLIGQKIGMAEWFEKQFEREDALLPGWGSAWYVAGFLLLATVLTDTNQIAAGIFVLGISDAASTIIGKTLGKHKLPYNKNKSIEGSVAFFISALPAWFFVGEIIIPIAFLAALVESLPLKIDDNITIPLVCIAVFLW